MTRRALRPPRLPHLPRAPRALTITAILPLALAGSPAAALASSVHAPGAAAPVELEPLQQRHVAAPATSVAHLDLHRAMQTTLGAELFASIERHNEDDVLAALTTRIDVRLGEDVRAITLYDLPDAEAGADDEDAAALLIYGSERLDRWDEALAEHQPDVQPAPLDGRPVRAVAHEDESWLGVLLPRDEGRLWVIATDRPALERAVSVIEGEAPAAEIDKWPLGAPPQDAFLYIASPSLERLEKWAPASNVARKASGYAFALGQRGEEAFARLQIHATEEGDAEAIVGICQGLVGLARLTLSGEDEFRPLLQLLGSIRFTTRERLIEVAFTHDAAALCEALREVEDHKPAALPEEPEQP